LRIEQGKRIRVHLSSLAELEEQRLSPELRKPPEVLGLGANLREDAETEPGKLLIGSIGSIRRKIAWRERKNIIKIYNIDRMTSITYA